ncbi:MAG: hypothetical protein IJ746_00415 [Ruminococcus sp.]|nr:hypothetical protein [Ruminococcus sp.]
MNRDIFLSIRSQLAPDEGLVQRTLQLAEGEPDEPKTEEGENKQPQRTALRSRRAGIAAAVLAVVVAVGAVFGIARLSRRETADPALSAADSTAADSTDSAQAPPAAAPNQQDFDRAISAAYQLEIGMPVSEAVELLSGACENAPVYSTRQDDLLADMAFDFGGIRLLLLTSSDRLTAVEIQTIPDGMINTLMPLYFYDPEAWSFDLGADDPMQWAMIKWSQARQLKTRDEVRGELGQPDSTDGGSDIYEEYLRIDYTEEGEVKGFYVSGLELPFWRELREKDVFVVSEEIDNERYSEYDTEDYQHIYDLNGVMDYLRYLTVGMPADEVRQIMADACPDGPSETADSQEVYTINGYDVTLYFMDMLGSVPDSPLTSVTVKKHEGYHIVTFMPLPSSEELAEMDRLLDWAKTLSAWYSVIDCRTRAEVRAILGEPDVSKHTYEIFSFGDDKLMVQYAFEDSVVGFKRYEPVLDYWYELSERLLNSDESASSSVESRDETSAPDESGADSPEDMEKYREDFDRMMADVAGLTSVDRDVFFEDFESFDDSKFSGFLLFSDADGSSSSGYWLQKKYLYGPYMLTVMGTKDLKSDVELPETDRQLFVLVERPANLFQSGYTYPYVELRVFDKNGKDLPVEQHTKEEIDSLAKITPADIIDDPQRVEPSSREANE